MNILKIETVVLCSQIQQICQTLCQASITFAQHCYCTACMLTNKIKIEWSSICYAYHNAKGMAWPSCPTENEFRWTTWHHAWKICGVVLVDTCCHAGNQQSDIPATSADLEGTYRVLWHSTDVLSQADQAEKPVQRTRRHKAACLCVLLCPRNESVWFCAPACDIFQVCPYKHTIFRKYCAWIVAFLGLKLLSNHVPWMC